MVISYNSQLGLRMNSPQGQLYLLNLLKSFYKGELDLLESAQKIVSETGKTDDDGIVKVMVDDDSPEYHLLKSYLEESNIQQHQEEKKIKEQVELASGAQNIFNGAESKYFFICDSVYKAAELIKIKENFTGRTLKDISFGKYTYLMGKNKTVRFIVVVDAIKGIYYDDKENIVFEWGIEMNNGGYYFNGKFSKEFTTLMQILTFVELGDIEVVELKGGRNNGGEKGKDKITNTANNTVFVVDSSWNKIVIRTDGFGVRGHFKLQPCGAGFADRKLIWINAFEKHGYTRRPKAEIIR